MDQVYAAYKFRLESISTHVLFPKTLITSCRNIGDPRIGYLFQKYNECIKTSKSYLKKFKHFLFFNPKFVWNFKVNALKQKFFQVINEIISQIDSSKKSLYTSSMYLGFNLDYIKIFMALNFKDNKYTIKDTELPEEKVMYLLPRCILPPKAGSYISFEENHKLEMQV